MKYLSGVLMLFSFVLVQAQDQKFSRPDLPGDVMVDVGLNFWSDTPDSLNTRGWPSKSIGIYYTQRKVLLKRLSFYYGVGFGMEKVAFEEDSTLYFNNNTLSLGALPFPRVTKNKLAMTFLDIPVDLRFHLSETEDGEGPFIGVGGIVGVRMNSHVKWKYNDGGGNSKIKTKDSFNLASFRYGYVIRAGFKGVHLFYKRYLSDTFKDPLNGVNPQMTTIGINVTGF